MPARFGRFVPHMAVLSGAHAPNSLSAIRECFDANVARIEIDTHSLTGDDYAVFHDHRLESHTTGSGTLGRATPNDIRAARFRDRPDDRPPLLTEVIAAARGARTEIQLDLKDWRPLTDDRVHALLEAVAPMKERVIVSTGQDWNLRILHQADPYLPIGFDPGHYIDHASEGSPFFLPRTMGAYGYRDDHPLAIGRTGDATEYLAQRFALLMLQAHDCREFFLSYRLVLQMLDDGFNVADFLHAAGLDANVWTPDFSGATSVTMLRRLIGAGVDRITTNTTRAWERALAEP
jgi:glycerophosphoryl diester phosphodiesterase